jgi:hypothetical protein
MIDTANSVLRPFVNPHADLNARQCNLRVAVIKAAQFAFILFSQPAHFEFDYTGIDQPNSLVVFPALVQTVNDETEIMSPPRMMREREIVTGLRM